MSARMASNSAPQQLRHRIGERIRRWRKGREWSQERLADELDVSRETVCRWENGAVVPCITQLARMATYGMDINHLLTGFSAEHWSA